MVAVSSTAGMAFLSHTHPHSFSVTKSGTTGITEASCSTATQGWPECTCGQCGHVGLSSCPSSAPRNLGYQGRRCQYYFTANHKPGSGWGPVCELTFYMWSEKNLTSFPDPKWGMQIIILHWAEQEAKLKIFTAPGRLTGSWSQRLSLRLYNALSILDTELPVFTIWKCATGKNFLKGGLQGPLFYGI